MNSTTYFPESDDVACHPSDNLCCQMLKLGAFAEGTQQMTGPEIIALLSPFFGRDTLDRVLAKFSGANA
jgi:hypothetical protein